ncbi:MAG: T9SS type A sorting domain-containing protein [Chitinophagaceae bacterium]
MRKSLFFIFLFTCARSYAQIGPTNIITGRLVSVSPKLTDIGIPTRPTPRTGGREFGEHDEANKKVRFSVDNPSANSVDNALQRAVAPAGTLNTLTAPLGPTLTFDGVVSGDNTALFGTTAVPPDPVMNVGPNHVVMMANNAHKVYNKSGTLLTGPTKFSAIATGAGDDGDPIALYDQLADRWLLMQFDVTANVDNNSLYFCISQTNDPTGAYNVYKFLTPGVFPDYPHIGIWNNSYVITTHEFNLAVNAYSGQGFYAVDRKKMVEGKATATLVRFQDGSSHGFLPVSFEGLKTPEASSQALFVGFDADEYGGGHSDQLMVRTLTPNFGTPAASLLSAASILPTSSFDGRSPSVGSAIEQSGTTDGLDALADRMMSRIIYRRFDNYESLVMNYVVNVSGVSPSNAGTYQAAMRWYELTRPTPSSPWVITQQSTYAPTGVGNGAAGDNRWMGCTGIDQRGNIAMGYEKSSSTTFPGIYYAERTMADPLSTLSTEQLFFAGTGSQTGSSNRWGDYSAMAIDPTDDETLWYTNEYYSTTTSFNFKTRIGSFKINDPRNTSAVHFKYGGTIARQKDAPSGGFKDYLIDIVIDNAPSNPVNVTLSHTGTAVEGVDYDLLNTVGITLSAGNLSKQFTLRVYNNSVAEADQFIDFAYTLNVNGGTGVAGNYNQKHRVTIIANPNCLASGVSYSCVGTVATLTAGCATGNAKWYDASGSSLLFTGSPYITPSLAGPTTFKVRCEGGTGGCDFAQITVFPVHVYVNSAAAGANNGTSWANAFTDLQSALNFGCTEVWVAKGTYKPTSCLTCVALDGARDSSFKIPSGIKIYGGFAGTETNLSDRNLALVHTTNLSILSGDLNSDDGANFTNVSDNTKTVVKFINAASTTLIDGFTITSGSGTIDGSGVNNSTSSSPQIVNCIISGNAGNGVFPEALDQQNTTLSNTGTGLTITTYLGQTFTPAISGSLTKADINLFCAGCTGTTPNLILSVRATSAGLPTGADLATATIAGFSSGAAVFYQGTFATALAVTAGTQYALVIRPVSNPSAGTYALTRSSTDVYAGGNRVNGTSSGTVWTSPLTGGVTTDAGFHSYVTVTTTTNGGGILNNGTLSVVNSLITGNNAISGGAIYNNGSLAITNSTISGNAATNGGGVLSNGGAGITTIKNSIFFANTNTFANTSGGTANAASSFFDNMTNVTDGGSNITSAISPFVSTTDFHLNCTTTAINAGSSSNIPAGIITDIEGNVRTIGTNTDMGAYESISGAGSLVGAFATSTQNVSGSTTFTASCNALIAIVDPGSGGTIGGSVKATVWVESTQPAYNNRPYLKRHYEITPAVNAASATGRITLYATQAEFDAFNNYPYNGPDLPINAADAASNKANLRIYKYSGVSSNGSGTPDSYAQPGIIINPVDADIVWDGVLNCWKISFDVTGFSGFLIGNSVPTILPLTNIELGATLQGQDALLNWVISQPLNGTRYELQRSADASLFVPVYTITGNAGTSKYTFTDAALANGTYYYRIRKQDIDNTVSFSNIALVKMGGKNLSVTVYPNPVVKGNALQISVGNGRLQSWKLVDALGRSLLAKNGLNMTGSMQVDIPSTLPEGVYQLILLTDKGTYTEKILLQ